LLANWGNAISQRKDLAEFVQSLASFGSALVLVQVPAGEALSTMPTGVRLYTLGNETNPIPADLLGPAPAVDPQMQGQSFLCLISSNSARLVPGAAVTCLLSLPGEPRPGALLPREGVVRFNGGTWVYLQNSADQFERREVQLDSPLPNGWFVTSGLKPQDKIVTTGAQQLLSEELKGQIEE